MAVVLVLGLMALSIPGMFLRAYVNTILWGWFIVPFGLPPLTLAWAFGLSIVLATFGPRPPHRPESEKGKFHDQLDLIVTGVVVSLMAWGIGWIAHSFMPIAGTT